jgi:thymidylate synthase
VIRARNVCEALRLGLGHLIERGVREETRAGPALVAPTPVVTATERPRERVLFSPVRDANPFFHVYESVWMLAGRRDAAPLLGFVRGFDTYAEKDGTVHGAYGFRWRHHFGIDQLKVVTEKLIKNPGDRQAVVTMWDPEYSACDLTGDWRDRPCNTHLYLRMRDNMHRENFEDAFAPEDRVLDMTVCCRSNDAIWGCHGANAVHFSVLHEYLAVSVGAEVGVMYQVSSNYHAYLREVDRLAIRTPKSTFESLRYRLRDDRYLENTLTPSPMFSDPKRALEDAEMACAAHDAGWTGRRPEFANSWFSETLAPAMLAHLLFKSGDHDLALKWCDAIESPDWRVACREWLERRVRR